MQESHSIKYSKPYLQEMLSILKMDKEFYSAKGNYLYSLEGQECIKYLDFAGGYGALLLGHNHPDLIDTARELLDVNICSHHQLSKKSKLDALCKKINDLLSNHTNLNYTTIVLNTGAEAVEVAIKHAILAFHNKFEEINKEIFRELMIIQESYFYKYPNCTIIYDGHEINSIEEVRLLLESINNNDLNICKPKIIASKKSFHGKTLGALSITSNQTYRMPFLKYTPFETIFLDSNAKCPEDLFKENKVEISIPKINKNGQLSFKKRSFSLIAAAIIEPIIGEGGIHVISEEFLDGLRKFTEHYSIPLIFDEIQSGCFRTGKFLASFHTNVIADYYIIGKSLGGGLCKISAVSIENSLYVSEFDLLHSSTFAEDDYSTSIAHKSLELLCVNKDRIEKTSSHLLNSLQDLKKEYSNVIQEVRGLGLMIGISFESMEFSSSFGIQGISRSKYFGYILAAYLLNVKNIRVSVTLSDSKTLRLLPSLLIDKKQISKLIKALDDLCKILSYGDFYSLISFLLPNKYQHLRPFSNFNPQTIQMDELNGCVDEVGFLLHYIDIHTIREYLPSLDILPEEIVLYIIKKLNLFSEPVIIGRNRIRNSNGKEICITFAGLPFTSKMITDDIRGSLGNISKYQSICNKAIDLLYGLGISKIGLGQYNSIIMQNGRAITNSNVRVTTGNGYTTFSVLQKVIGEIRRGKRSYRKLGVVGAGGNIAKILSTMIVGQFNQILLLGRSNGNLNKLMDHAGYLIQEILYDIESGHEYDNVIYDQIKTLKLNITPREINSNYNNINLWNSYFNKFTSDRKIEIGTDLNLLCDCDMILVATSDPTPFLKKDFLKKGAFICDISVPLNCKDDLLNDQDYQVVKGGIVRLTHGEKLYPPGLYLDDGQAFACMAETMLMGFEHAKEQYSFGEISKDQVNELGNRVLMQGFIIDADVKEIAG